MAAFQILQFNRCAGDVQGKYYVEKQVDDVTEDTKGNFNGMREYLWPNGEWRDIAYKGENDHAYYTTEEEANKMLAPFVETPEESDTEFEEPAANANASAFADDTEETASEEAVA